jgi:hypothetical protein
MRLDINLVTVDPTLAEVIPDGITLAHVLTLFRTAYPITWEQLLRQRLTALGVVPPSDIPAAKLREFIEGVLRAAKSEGIRDPFVSLADMVQREAKEAATKLGTSADIGNIAAQPKSDPTPVKLENSPTGTSAASPLPAAQAIPYGTTKVEEERQPDQPITNTRPQTIGNPEPTNPETANARDEISIDGRRLVGEHRVAERLGRTVRSLQRWRTAGKGPPRVAEYIMTSMICRNG